MIICADIPKGNFSVNAHFSFSFSFRLQLFSSNYNHSSEVVRKVSIISDRIKMINFIVPMFLHYSLISMTVEKEMTFHSVVSYKPYEVLNIIDELCRNWTDWNSVASSSVCTRAKGKTMKEIKVKHQFKQIVPVWLCSNVGYICLVVSSLSSLVV